MPRTVMRFTNPTFKVALTQAGLTTGTAVECQLVSAVVQAQPVYNTIPATGCAGSAQSPGTTGWNLLLTWLQDWGASKATSLSWFAYDNDGKQVWWEFTPDKTVATTKITGTSFAAAGDMGGTFGDGSAGQATSTWPCPDKPVPVGPALMAEGQEGQEDAVVEQESAEPVAV